MEAAKRKKRGLLGFLFVVLCIIIILFGIFKTDFFLINNVVVENNLFVSKQEIITSSQLYGKNIFLIHKDKIKDYVKLNPYIKDIVISRKFPRTVVLDVEEKKIRGIVKIREGLINVDNEGKMVQIVNRFPKGLLPVLLETGVKKFVPGASIYPQGSNNCQALVAALSVSDYNETRYQFYSIDVKDPFNIILRTNNGRIVKIGSWNNMEYKLSYAMAVLKSAEVKNLKGYIQLQENGEAVFKKN